ncbi:MAG: HEAT repeat domain-containing protein [Acidobacteriia bacterium]|nr:HEAT repeat domain-containing protein [Terriglobia bacterium]
MTHRPGRRAYLLITLFALLLVVIPFLFWYQTWFGRKLTDAQLDQYFADQSRPRHAQHALVQLSKRLELRQEVSRWYPNVLQQAANSDPKLRETAAWVMGQDRRYEPFHDALARLVRDPQPMVRRNAALALAGYGDGAARPELVAMLRPYTIAAPAAGTLKYRLKPGDYVNPDTLVAHIGAVEVRSPVPGEVRALERRDGVAAAPGDPLASLAPDQHHVWEALRALYLVGQPADLEDVERYLRPVPGMPEAIRSQAALTAQAIRSRQPAQ